MASISESSAPRRALAALAGGLAIALVVMLWAASSVRAAELVYWDNYDSDSVSFANIDGSGGGPLNLAGVTLDDPEGMAYDSVTNRLFVASSGGGPSGDGEILYVNLDGSGAGVFSAPGAPLDSPQGIAIDPVTRMVYWSNTGNESVAWARLDGSGGGPLNTSGGPTDSIYKLAIDPAAGRVYWSNNPPGAGPESISFASADNTGGGGVLDLAGATPPGTIRGLSVDPTGNRIYWLDTDEEKVGFAALGGGSGGDLNMAGSVFKSPYGLAFDPAIGRFYWANYNGGTELPANAIGFVNLAGGGGGISIATAPVDGPQDPVILKSPSGTGAPVVTRSTKSRSSFSCSTGSWAADFAGSFVYQAPRSFAYQWLRNGAAIEGATTSTLNAKTPGQYACQVTATNHAGTASQLSAAAKVKAAKVRLSTKLKAKAKAGGVAKFKVTGVNQGSLQSRKARVCTKLSKGAKGVLKAPKCKTLGKLKGGGKDTEVLKLKVAKSAEAGTYKVTFTVHGSPGKPFKAKVIVKP